MVLIKQAQTNTLKSCWFKKFPIFTLYADKEKIKSCFYSSDVFLPWKSVYGEKLRFQFIYWWTDRRLESTALELKKRDEEEEIVPFIFKNANKRNIHDRRSECFKMWVSRFHWGPHVLHRTLVFWSTLAWSASTFAWRRRNFHHSERGESGIHHSNDDTLF